MRTSSTSTPFLLSFTAKTIWPDARFDHLAAHTWMHDADISAITERVDHLCGLMSIQLVGQEPRIFEKPPGYLPGLPSLREYPLDESVISRHWRREFPFMTIQTPSMMCLLELDPRLAAQLVARERTDVSMLSTPSDLQTFLVDHEDGIRSVMNNGIRMGVSLICLGHLGPFMIGYTIGTLFFRQNSLGFIIKS